MASGKKQARDELESNLREAARRFEVTVRDHQGRSVSFDELLGQVLPAAESSTEGQGTRKMLLWLLVLGAVFLLGITTFFVFSAY